MKGVPRPFLTVPYTESMTHLRERTIVDCPVGEAEPRLYGYFESLRQPDGVARMRLRVAVAGSSRVLGVSLEREVRVETERLPDEDLKDPIRITWRPEGNAAFPRFDGMLSLWAAEDGKSSYLEIDGTYEPPFGVAGQVFDEAIGRRLAASTAREFLSDLRRAIEMPPSPR